MRSRIAGGIALSLGMLMVILLLIDNTAIQWRPFLGGLVFIAMGGYHLLTVKKTAKLKEFIVEGKLSHEKSADISFPSTETLSAALARVLAAPDAKNQLEAGLLQSQNQLNRAAEEIFDCAAKKHGLSDSERLELEAPIRNEMAEMFAARLEPKASIIKEMAEILAAKKDKN